MTVAKAEAVDGGDAQVGAALQRSQRGLDVVQGAGAVLQRVNVNLLIICLHVRCQYFIPES